MSTMSLLKAHGPALNFLNEPKLGALGFRVSRTDLALEEAVSALAREVFG